MVQHANELNCNPLNQVHRIKCNQRAPVPGRMLAVITAISTELSSISVHGVVKCNFVVVCHLRPTGVPRHDKGCELRPNSLIFKTKCGSMRMPITDNKAPDRYIYLTCTTANKAPDRYTYQPAIKRPAGMPNNRQKKHLIGIPNNRQ